MSDIVKQHYNENAEMEWERLNNPYSRVEFLSHLYLIDKYFPKEGKLCDIGCGPGRYSIEMLKKGYDVTLFELSNEELKLAEKNINEEGLKAEEFICDSAVNINRLEDGKYNGILMMGPMYHIHGREDRITILKTMGDKLAEDGVALVAYINSYGVLKAGITECFEEFEKIEMINNCFNECKYSKDECFTEAYFTTPEHALKEIEEAGLEIITYAGSEGFISGTHYAIKKVYEDNRKAYDNLVQRAAETCEMPQFRDATEHLSIIVRKKTM